MALAEDCSLDDVRGVIADLAAPLDPASRYLPELLSVLNASRDVHDLVARLSASSRGARHAGAGAFSRMTLEQKLRCNLITNETVLFRFSEGEWEEMQKRVTGFAGREKGPLPRGTGLAPLAAETGGRILCAPCSHGEEAFSIAAACLQERVLFSVEARDIQPECIAEARRGRLSMGFPEAFLATPAVVGHEVLERIHFGTADLFQAPGSAGGVPAGPYDLVVCRNFLGYFREALAIPVALSLASTLNSGGALFLDSFCLGKFSGLSAALARAGLARVGGAPIFAR